MEWPHVTTIGRCYCQVEDIIAIDDVMISVFNANVMTLPSSYLTLKVYDRSGSMYVLIDIG